MYIYLTLGWLQVGEDAFSRVEQYCNGMLHLSQSLVVDETIGWHAQVREICHYNHNKQHLKCHFMSDAHFK